jgi:hypothetical protein
MQALLEHAGLTLDVRLGRSSVARIGRGARPSLASRIAGLGDAELSWHGLLLGVQALTLGRGRRERD